MALAKSGKRYGNKFKANRADRAAAEGMEKEPGKRAQANEIEGKGQGDAYEQEEQMEEEISPGIHDQVASMTAQHGPASEVHIMHDHVNGQHNVSTVHADGFQHNSTHATADEAHMAGAAAGGINPEGNYPEGHEAPETNPNPKKKSKPQPTHEEDDSYEPEPLD